MNLIIHIGVSLGGDPAVDALWEIGAKRTDAHWYECWRWFTSAWIHSDYEHVFFNCMYLLVAGRLLEPTIGSGRFALLYLVSIMGSAIGTEMGRLFDTHVDFISAGASGAVCGIMGALLVVPCCVALLRALLVWAFVGLEVGQMMSGGPQLGIGYGAHAGGLVIGVIAGMFLGRGAHVPEPPDLSPSTQPLPASLNRGTIPLIRRLMRQEGNKSGGFRVARGMEGKYPAGSTPVPSTDDPGVESANSDGPRPFAVVNVWPEQNGMELR